MSVTTANLLHSVPRDRLDHVLKEGLRATSSFDDLDLEMRRGVIYCWLRRQLLVFGALGLVMVLGWLLAMIVLDNLAMLSTAQLVLGWVLLAAGAAGWLFLFANRVVVRRPPGTRLALLYEARVPRQRNRLINAVQFLESRQAQHDPIAYAAVIENSATLDPGSAPRAIDPRPARRALLGLGVGVLLLAGYGGLRPQWAGNALARLMHPLAPAAHLLAIGIWAIWRHCGAQ